MSLHEDLSTRKETIVPAQPTAIDDEIVLVAKRVLAPGKGLGKMYIVDDIACPIDVLHSPEEIPTELRRLEDAFAAFGNPFANTPGTAAARIIKMLDRLGNAPFDWNAFTDEFIPEVLTYSDQIKGSRLLRELEPLRARLVAPDHADDLVGRFISSAREEMMELAHSMSFLKGGSETKAGFQAGYLSPIEMQKLSCFTIIRDTVRAARGLVRKGHDAAWSVYSCFSARIDEHTQMIVRKHQDAEKFPERAKIFYSEAENTKSKREEIETARTEIVRFMAGERTIPREQVIFVGSVVQVPSVEHVPSNLQSGIIAEIGEQSHLVIVALAQNIPVVVPTPTQLDILEKLGAGTLLFVDGDAGEIVIDPSPARIAAYQQDRRERPTDTPLAARTLDGTPIQIQLNISVVDENVLERITNFQADLGLVRTELVFRQTGVAQTPSTLQQTAYRSLLAATEGEVVLRTWDLSHDKAGMRSPSVPLDGDEIGISHARAIESEREEQLKNMIQAAVDVGRDVRILFPQINSRLEMQQCADLVFERALKQVDVPAHLGRSQIEDRILLGPQIESLAGIDSLHEILTETTPAPEFVAIGTNDLGMEIGRLSDLNQSAERGTGDVDHYSPFFLLALGEIVTITRSVSPEIPVEVCGQMASNPEFVPVLLGLGIRRLSSDMNYAKSVETACGKYKVDECKLLVEDLLNSSSSIEVERKLRQFILARANETGHH